MARKGNQAAVAAVGALALLGAALVIYGPVLHGGWLWDDREDIPDNPFLRSAAGLRYIWTARGGLDFYPLKSSLEWLEWHLWGSHTAGYHIVNLILLVVAAAMLWRCLPKFGLRPGWALAAALLYVVHPIAVGSVAWLAELKDTLSVPLLLAAAVAYVSYVEKGKGWRLAASWAWFAAAMLAKSAVMMFPFWMLLYAWWAGFAVPRGEARGGFRASFVGGVVASLPFLAVSIVLGYLAVHLQATRSMASDKAGLGGVFFRASLSAQVLRFYVQHSVWPARMLPVYLRWAVPGGAAGVFALWPWVLLACLAAWAWVKRRGWGRHALLGGGWFVLNLVPVLGWVGVSYMRFSWVMDHFAYASLAGLVALVAAAAQVWTGASEKKWRMPAAVGGFAVVVIALATISRGYARAYLGEEQIWTYAQSHAPELWMANSNLGAVRINQGRYAEADRLLRDAVRLNPGAPEAHRNYAVALDNEGHVNEAIAQSRIALQLRPDYTLAEDDLGTFLGQQGNYKEALPHLDYAVRHNRTDAASRHKLGVVLLQLGHPEGGIMELKIAANLAPNDGQIALDLGVALGQQGKVAEAYPYLELAARLMPTNALAQRNLAAARQILKRP